MEIIQHYPLRTHNTFAIDTIADWWITYDGIEDLQTLARDEYFTSQPFLPIGSGSNLLFTQGRYRGVVLHSEIKDLLYYDETHSTLTHTGQQHVRVGSGIEWDALVASTLDQGLYGLENLSLIPGTVGAAAVQNIGAYGSEFSQFLIAVEMVDLATGIAFCIPNKLCNYRYRYSIFKEPQFRSCIITYVHLLLSTEPTCNLCYASLAKAFDVQESNIKYLIALIEKYGNNILRKDKNRVYSKEFKLQAINRILINHESINSVALDIGLVSAGILHNWLSKFKENGYNVIEKKRGRKPKAMTKPKKKNDKALSEKDKIKQLEDEILYLKAENEYLKKLRALVQERELKEKKK